jgi:hypothetical protein
MVARSKRGQQMNLADYILSAIAEAEVFLNFCRPATTLPDFIPLDYSKPTLYADKTGQQWLWVADAVKVDRSGRVLYFRNGVRVANPWLLSVDARPRWRANDAR